MTDQPKTVGMLARESAAVGARALALAEPCAPPTVKAGMAADAKAGMAADAAADAVDKSAGVRQAAFDVQRTHLLHTIIRTHVFGKAKQRLTADDDDLHMDDLATPESVGRFKRALYDAGSPPAPPGGAGAAPHQALMRNPAAMPVKLAFLEAVARALGDDWCDDSRSFLDITIAMGRLQVVLRKLMLANAAQWAPLSRGSALITVPPGEEHHFGQCIVEELFRARGWSTDLFCPADEGELVARITAGRFDIVCLSWSTAALTDIAASAIEAIEKLPARMRPAVIAGGLASRDNSGWMVRLGVDCICDSTYGALAVAQAMLDQRIAAGGALPPGAMTRPSAVVT